jgi:uncharacterized damage-inducible protein DinB
VNALLLLLRHKTWATVRLIEHCQSLKDEHLNLTISGTYGTIPATLQHLVEAEEDYFSVLTGEQVPQRQPSGSVPLPELAQRIRRLGPRWETLAEDTDIQERTATFPDGIGWPGAVLMAQALHHADDHRTHVLSILGAHGLEVPRLDVWAYARSAGLQRS